MIKVNKTIEPVQAHQKVVLEANSEDEKWFFTYKKSENQLETLAEEIRTDVSEGKIMDQKQMYLKVEEKVFDSLKIERNKTGNINSQSLVILPEVIEAFRNELVSEMGLSNMKFEQTKLEMPED